jgi:hypothetical protein
VISVTSSKNAEVSEMMKEGILVCEEDKKVEHTFKEHKEVICDTIILDCVGEKVNEKTLRDELSMFQEACQGNLVRYEKPLPESEVHVERHDTREVRIIDNIEQNHIKDMSVGAKFGEIGQRRRFGFPGNVGTVDEVGKSLFSNLSLKGEESVIPISEGLDRVRKGLNNGSNPETVREDVVESVTPEEIIEVSRETVTESNEVTIVIVEADSTSCSR